MRPILALFFLVICGSACSKKGHLSMSDPITDSGESWVLGPPPGEAGAKQVWDVKSGAEGSGIDGSEYQSW